MDGGEGGEGGWSGAGEGADSGSGESGWSGASEGGESGWGGGEGADSGDSGGDTELAGFEGGQESGDGDMELTESTPQGDDGQELMSEQADLERPEDPMRTEDPAPQEIPSETGDPEVPVVLDKGAEDGEQTETDEEASQEDETEEDEEVSEEEQSETDEEKSEEEKADSDEVSEEVRKEISEKSEYSDEVNRYIRSTEELEVYQKAGLKEVVVDGRTCLVREGLDLDYVDPASGLTNRELMAEGRSPYDPETRERIELHHIGQEQDSPLAELTANSEHGGENDTILHDKSKESWRSDAKANNHFNNVERPGHWRARANGR